jgi:hypothetical protein
LQIKIIITFLLILLSAPCRAEKLYNEAFYQNEWCSRWNGKAEYQLPDKTRVDCLTKNYAVEFDFAKKWAEAVGQSIHYGQMTNRKPAIILIIEQPKDFVYYNRLKRICEEHGITLWYMKSPLYNDKFNLEYYRVLALSQIKELY